MLKRSKALIVPFATFAIVGVAVLWWARLSLAEGLTLPKYWANVTSGWTAIDHTCLRRLFALFTENKPVVGIGVWAVWFTLYVLVALRIKEPLTQLAALLLLALLPVYHYSYDMVAAVPAFAVILRRCHLFWAAAISFFLSCTLFAQLSKVAPPGILRDLCGKLDMAYFPLLILLLLGGLLWLERRQPAPVKQEAK